MRQPFTKLTKESSAGPTSKAVTRRDGALNRKPSEHPKMKSKRVGRKKRSKRRTRRKTAQTSFSRSSPTCSERATVCSLINIKLYYSAYSHKSVLGFWGFGVLGFWV